MKTDNFELKPIYQGVQVWCGNYHIYTIYGEGTELELRVAKACRDLIAELEELEAWELTDATPNSRSTKDGD